MQNPSTLERIPTRRPNLEAVVSVLEDEYYTRIEALWEELDKEFGLRGVYITPVPHFSYQVARSYQRDRLETLLGEFAQKHHPFRIRTGGLGLFTGEDPTLYIPVVRSLSLTTFHQSLWEAISPAATGIVEHYDPGSWFPHITLTQNDTDPQTIGAVFRYLCERDFSWEIEVNNVSLICEMCGTQGVGISYPLSPNHPPDSKGDPI